MSTTKRYGKRVYFGSVGTNDKFLEININFNLDQMVDFPPAPRINNILDLFLTTNVSLINRIKPVSGMSDHDMVVIDFDITAKIPQNKPRKVYKFAKANYEGLKMDIKQFKEEYFGYDPNNITVEENCNKFKKLSTKQCLKTHPYQIAHLSHQSSMVHYIYQIPHLLHQSSMVHYIYQIPHLSHQSSMVHYIYQIAHLLHQSSMVHYIYQMSSEQETETYNKARRTKKDSDGKIQATPSTSA